MSYPTQAGPYTPRTFTGLRCNLLSTYLPRYLAALTCFGDASHPVEPGLPRGSVAHPFSAGLSSAERPSLGTHPCCGLTAAPLLPRPPTPLADRAFSTFPSFGSVGAWLDALDLGRYKDSFAAGGYGSLEAVAAMAAQ